MVELSDPKGPVKEGIDNSIFFAPGIIIVLLVGRFIQLLSRGQLPYTTIAVYSDIGVYYDAIYYYRGNSSISRMPGCGPNALPKNWK